MLGVTGLGKKLIDWLPMALKSAIIMGAAIAALKRVFVDDAESRSAVSGKRHDLAAVA